MDQGLALLNNRENMKIMHTLSAKNCRFGSNNILVEGCKTREINRHSKLVKIINNEYINKIVFFLKDPQHIIYFLLI